MITCHVGRGVEIFLHDLFFGVPVPAMGTAGNISQGIFVISYTRVSCSRTVTILTVMRGRIGTGVNIITVHDRIALIALVDIETKVSINKPVATRANMQGMSCSPCSLQINIFFNALKIRSNGINILRGCSNLHVYRITNREGVSIGRKTVGSTYSQNLTQNSRGRRCLLMVKVVMCINKERCSAILYIQIK